MEADVVIDVLMVAKVLAKAVCCCCVGGQGVGRGGQEEKK